MLQYPLNQNTAESKAQIAAIARGLFLMGQMAELQPVTEWLIAEGGRLAGKSCEESDDKEMLREQGAVLLIKDLYQKIRESRDVRDRAIG